MSSMALAIIHNTGLRITPSALAAHTQLWSAHAKDNQLFCAMQIYHDEGESMQEVEVEDVLALQGQPGADSESEETVESDQMSASASDDESEGD